MGGETKYEDEEALKIKIAIQTDEESVKICSISRTQRCKVLADSR